MQVEINLNKSVDENAGRYFDKAKKLKKKLEGAKETVELYKKKLEDLKKQEDRYNQQEEAKEKQKQKRQENAKWYHKFHYFTSSEKLTCIGGRDATQNEILIKKHTEKDDWVLHTDMAGSPFFIIKEGQTKGTEQSLNEAAQAVACYSKAWKEGHTTAEVFYVKPEQVTKQAQTGEFLKKGSFMIKGKTTYLRPTIEFAFSKDKNNSLIWGPKEALENNQNLETKDLITIVPGREKKSKIAKQILNEFETGLLDDIVAALPAGGADIKGLKKKNKSKKNKKKK